MFFAPSAMGQEQLDAQQAFEIDEERITGLDIEEHFAFIESVYTGIPPDRKKIDELIPQYLTDDFELKNLVRNNRDLRDVPQKILEDKQTFIKSTQNRDYTLLKSKLSHTITDIKYLDDKAMAEVSFTGLFDGLIEHMWKEKGLVRSKFKSLSVCTIILKLEDNLTKRHKADCTTDVLYSKPEKV